MKKRHVISGAAITGICAFLIPFPAFAGQWNQQDNQWYYEQDGVNLNNGWNEIDGTWYYFKSSGVMAEDEIIEGYYVGPDGAWVEGENRKQRYEKEGDTAEDIISNYLTMDTKYSITLEELKNKNIDSYTAGRGSVYGTALNQQELDAVAVKVHEIVTNYITNDMSDVQKLDMLYAYLINTCAYAPTWEKNQANTAWGALVYGEAQCSGYARAFKALCDAVDIPCYYVHANKSALNPEHQWNIVQIGGKWYHMDTQACIFLVSDAVYSNMGMEWDRSEFPQCKESYFSISDQLMFPWPYAPSAEWIKK